MISYKDRTKKSSTGSMKSNMVFLRNQRNLNTRIFFRVFPCRAFSIQTLFKNFLSISGWGWVVNFRKKFGEMSWKLKIFTAYCLPLFAVKVLNCCELFIFTAYNGFLTKKTSVHGIETLTSCMSTTSYSTAASVTYLFSISSEFKSASINVGKQMRWSSQWILVRTTVKPGEFFFTAITAFLILICRKNWCGEFWWV